METPLLLVALLALCLMPSALALKCYECTNIPFYKPVSQCNAEKVETITCGESLDMCMTVKGTLKVPGHDPFNIELKNCSNSYLCDPTGQYYMCKLLNKTGIMVNCETKCCKGDLCNKGNAQNEAVGLFDFFAR